MPADLAVAVGDRLDQVLWGFTPTANIQQVSRGCRPASLARLGSVCRTCHGVPLLIVNMVQILQKYHLVLSHDGYDA